MKKIALEKLSNIAMTTGGEKKIDCVVCRDGVLRQWIGFGWIPVRTATKKDRKRYPTAED